jgi:hypothetical protein
VDTRFHYYVPRQELVDRAYAHLVGDVLPNNNILNIISKAQQAPYQDLVLELFRTGEPMRFTYDDPLLNYLYLNGMIDWEQVGPAERSVRFPCPFVHKRLFNYFVRTLFREGGQLYAPFADLSDTITETALHVRPLLRRYQTYLRENRSWLLRDVPRRATDLRPYEAVYHFNLYAYLERFLHRWGSQVLPEFPTGNGKVDLLLRHAGRVYGLEVKSFVDAYTYGESLRQAARYAQQLGLSEIVLALFVEAVDDTNRAQYEVAYVDAETGVTVTPVFVETG